ncbi:hypothetical protein P7L74_04350 (plasmid) [Tistrella mobilis]|uniref:hypothetical protein n=1 Tax=Tistrella mobilis TaxID=171437 RepID=UPI0035587A26
MKAFLVAILTGIIILAVERYTETHCFELIRPFCKADTDQRDAPSRESAAQRPATAPAPPAITTTSAGGTAWMFLGSYADGRWEAPGLYGAGSFAPGQLIGRDWRVTLPVNIRQDHYDYGRNLAGRCVSTSRPPVLGWYDTGARVTIRSVWQAEGCDEMWAEIVPLDPINPPE